MDGFHSSQVFLSLVVRLERDPVGLTSFPAWASVDEAIRLGKSNSKTCRRRRPQATRVLGMTFPAAWAAIHW
jgi:hypothetical protein